MIMIIVIPFAKSCSHIICIGKKNIHKHTQRACLINGQDYIQFSLKKYNDIICKE